MRIIGLKSGTSASGIDAALCDIDGTPPNLTATIVKGIHQPDPDGVPAQILAACEPESSGVDELARLNVALGEYFAQAALSVIEQAGLAPTDVDLIGSHGQPIWYNVEASGKASASLQLGEASIIAERTGITTINNFPQRDLAAGGQGAPLISYSDWLLHRHPDHWLAIQTLGGIASVTFLPPLSDTTSKPLAFDTGPGNILLDSAMILLTSGKRTLDRHGELARLGKADDRWLHTRMMHPYFNRRPPKTTGLEIFGAQMAESLVAMSQKQGMSMQDIMASVTAFVARSIAHAYKRFAPAPVGEILLRGGGRRNLTLVKLLREQFAPVPVRSQDDGDQREALAFALIAHETWHNRPGTLPAFTGAKQAAVLGQITSGANYADLLRRTWGGT